MEFTIIDCNEHPMNPGQGRGLGFVQALSGWTMGKNYEFARYEDILPGSATSCAAGV